MGQRDWLAWGLFRTYKTASLTRVHRLTASKKEKLGNWAWKSWAAGISEQCVTSRTFTLDRQTPCFKGKSPGVPCGCIPQLRLSMSGRLPPALWGVRGQSFESGHWHNAPGPGQEHLPGRTELQVEPSAKPVTETGNGPASPWGSTDLVPIKETTEITAITYLILRNIHS